MFINVTNGEHRNERVNGVFLIDKPVENNMVKVRLQAPVPPFKVNQPKIKLDMANWYYCNAEGEAVNPEDVKHTNPIAAMITGAVVSAQNDPEQEYLDNETEEEAMERIAHTFSMLETITMASSEGLVRGLIVSGPPGIGKSFGVEKVLNEHRNVHHCMSALAVGESEPFEIICGVATPISVYKTLYFNRAPGMVTVFDDCDSVLYEDDSLNILKAALDTKKERKIQWLSESRVLRDDGIPTDFVFEGSVIFLTNMDFDRQRNSRIGQHLEALISRCHYLDLSIHTQRDQVLRIKQIVRAGMLTDFEFRNGEEEMIVRFIEDNANYLRELSLRMVRKIAEFVKAQPLGWNTLVEATCLTRQAKYKRLHEEKRAKQIEASEREVVHVSVGSKDFGVKLPA